MALWRDPLDELIDELERAAPASSAADCELPDLVLMQQYLTTLLFGSDDDRARMKNEAWYGQWEAQWNRFSTRLQASRRRRAL